jgi:hypothetical protein
MDFWLSTKMSLVQVLVSTADNPHAAASIAESLYGRLLMTKSAIETLD